MQIELKSLIAWFYFKQKRAFFQRLFPLYKTIVSNYASSSNGTCILFAKSLSKV